MFCDGDFWHGRNLESRLSKLAQGHNSSYWVAKIQRNVVRDRGIDRCLLAGGWAIVRVWESELLRAPGESADGIAELLVSRALTATRLRHGVPR